MKKVIFLFLLTLTGGLVQAQPAEIVAKLIRATERLQVRNLQIDSFVVAITGASTNRQAPTAKAVYDLVTGSHSGHVIAEDGAGTADKDTLNFESSGDITFSVNTTSTSTDVSAVLNLNTIDSTHIINGGVSVLDLGQHGATSGQVLKWNGTQWAPGSDAGASIAANEMPYGTGSGITSDGQLLYYPSGSPSWGSKIVMKPGLTSNLSGIQIDSMDADGNALYLATPAQIGESTWTCIYGEVYGTAETDLLLNWENGSTSSSADSRITLRAATGDPVITFNTGGANSYYIGIDNSDADIFKLQYGSGGNPGSGTDGLQMSNTGKIGVGGAPVSGVELAVTGDLRVSELIQDGAGNGGTNGQVITSTGTAWEWADPVSGGHVIAGDGTPVTQRDTLNFVSSSSVTASVADGTTKSNVTLSVPTGGIGSTQILDGSVSSTDVDTTISNHLLPSGTNKWTLRHNGTAWAASSLLQNDGTTLGLNITPDVTYGMLYMKQSSTTDGLGIINSGGTGRIRMYHTSNTGYVKTDVYNMNIESAGQLSIYGPGGGGQTQQIFLSAQTNVTTATGNASLMRFGSTYAPTASGGDYSFMKFLPTINMTGSANQTVYCMDFNPTITSLNTGSLIGVNYRPSVGSFIYQTTGTSVNSHLIGNLGLGTGTTSPAAKLHIVGNGSTSSTFEQETFNSSDSIVLAVRDDRRVGVNTNAPAEALDVIGQARVDALDIRTWSGSSNTSSGQLQYHDGSGGTYSAYLTVGAGERRFPIMPYVIQLQAVDYNVDWTTGRTKAFWTVPERFSGWKVSKVYLMVSSIGSVTGNTVDIEKGGSNLSTQTISSSDHTVVLDTSISTGDIFTFNITGVGATASKGLYIEIELRYQ